MTPVGKAFLIAIANTLVIAVALTVEFRVHDWGLTFMMIAYAGWPAILLGYVLGKVAEATAPHAPWSRLAVLAFPACALVVALAARAHLLPFAPDACIPTLVAAAILERTTRAPQLVPRATVA